MNQLLAIRAFARVVEAGSFTRAADSLDMPNASLSKLVQELEAHLGVRLLQRTTRRVTVTPEGQHYYEKTGMILRTLDDPVVVVMGGLALAPVVEAPCAYCRGDEYWIWRSTRR